MDSEVFKFLSELEENNNREWFTANKSRFDKVKKNITDFVAQLILNVNMFDSSIGALDANKTLFRIYRDTRFTKDKVPYKINLGAMIIPERYKRSWCYPGYYLHLQNNESFVSMGIYMPDPSAQKKLRIAIDDDFEIFADIVKKLEPDFGTILREEDMLKRIPAGFDKNSPAAEYLKLKSIYLFKHFSNSEVLKNDFIETVTGLYKKCYPFKCWLASVMED
ncbi:MAG: DUF2461 domain-containing protein [Dysgonamonadaceae bacterium]|jgi:uncharacterized protein (TIGR02453 family)|nr:DUF2461 domain-containing protein [Dysgonamonadaceae bacterium]